MNYESAPSSSISYYSSDAPSPNKPELIINYTSSGTYYGNRPYVQNNGKTANCMGYALDFDLFLNSKSIGLEVSDINRKPIEEIYTAVLSRVEAWMRNNMGSRGWARIASYNSDIGLNQYRVVFRTGFGDRELVNPRTGELIRPLNNIYDRTDGDWDLYNAETDEGFDYHFWFQTSTGVWADKMGDGPSKLIEGVVDPSTHPWWPLFTHRSQLQYYKVDTKGI